MRKTWLAILLSMSFLNAESKDYVVFMVRGDVKVKIDGVAKPVTEKMIIKDTWEIQMDKNSTLTLKDEKKRRVPNLNGVKKGVLKNLIKSKDVTFIECVSDVWNYIQGMTVSDYGIEVDSEKTVYMQGSTSRGENAPDSLSFHNKIIKKIVEEAIKAE